MRLNKFRLLILTAMLAALFVNPVTALEKDGVVTNISVKGQFEVNITPVKDDIDMGRMLLDKVYSGALSGSAKGQMLSRRTEVQGSAAYVAIEHFEGELNGRKGGFSLVHKGLMDKGAQSLEINIVADSGSGELEGINGSMDIEIKDGQHFYILNYRL